MSVFKRIFSVLIVLTMLFAFSACGSAESVVGKWVGAVDYSELMSYGLSMNLNEALGAETGLDYTKVNAELKLDCSIDFDADGNYTLKINMGNIDTVLDNMFRTYYDYYLSFPGEHMSYEEFLDEANLNLDSVMGTIDGTAETHTGTYEQDGDTVIMDGDTNNVIKIDGDTMSCSFGGMAVLELKKQ